MEEIIEKCHGCQFVLTTRTCKVYAVPSVKWSAGNCPMATHVAKKGAAAEKELDPIKASKRKMKGGK